MDAVHNDCRCRGIWATSEGKQALCRDKQSVTGTSFVCFCVLLCKIVGFLRGCVKRQQIREIVSCGT